MAVIRPRTGDGPLEVVLDGHEIVVRIPLESGGRLVVQMSSDEARNVASSISRVVQ